MLELSASFFVEAVKNLKATRDLEKSRHENCRADGLRTFPKTRHVRWNASSFVSSVCAVGNSTA